MGRIGRDVGLFLGLALALAQAPRFSGFVASLAAAAVLLSGLLRLQHAESSRGRRSYRRHRWVRERVRLGRNLALWWSTSGAALLALALVVDCPLGIALLGLLVTLAILARSRKIATAWMTGGLLVAVTMVFCAACAFGLVVTAEVTQKFAPPAQRQATARPPLGVQDARNATASPPSVVAPSAAVTLPPPDYADLCPRLPDPMAIGHGLGELFRRDGAVEAGCGGRAWNPPGIPSVWVAAGLCSGELRSFAVATGGHASLLYDEPARFARQMAAAGQLLFAEAAKAGGGEVIAIGTGAGTYFFARSSPSIRPDLADARDCTEVGGVARPFVTVTPAHVQSWLRYLELEGWTWPDERLLRRLDERWGSGGRPMLDLVDLAPFMPPPL